MNRDKPSILIIDNEIEICNLFKDFFDFMGYESVIETDGRRVLDDLGQYRYDLMFVDLKMGSISGIDLLRKSKEVNPDAEVIVVTGFGSEETVLKTLYYGAFSYIQKPISFSEIKIQTEEALAKRRFNLKTASLRLGFDPRDPGVKTHFEHILSLDRLSSSHLTLDIETLADSILSGVDPFCGYC